MIGMRFIADSMLGKLAKWLRLAGLDVSYVKNIEDDLLIKKALSEDRIILTRDRNIEKRRAVKRCLLIESDHLEEQLSQFIGTFTLNSFNEAFSRCIRCNTPLEEIHKDSLVNRVPNYIWKTNDKFMQCNSCNRIYWPGTHRENAEKFLRRFL